jgi:hypothetical protein
MTDEYIYITGQDGEIYEFHPTEALLSFLQHMAEDEVEEQEMDQREHNLTGKEETYH